jgi:CMP-N,N'-diacetyllegionaminic acid synthase
MKCLTLITARGGSKGLPGKNIKNFHGHPLIAWSIALAKRSSLTGKVVVSTDCQKIGEISIRYGAEVIWRPEEISNDTASSLLVVEHAIIEMQKHGFNFDALVLLQPTSPIRRKFEIDGMLNKLAENWSTADAVVSVHPMKPSPLHAFSIAEDYIQLNKSFFEVPRQHLQSFYASYGVAWVIKVSTLLNEKTFYPSRTLAWPVMREQAVDIDDLADFVSAEALFGLAKNHPDIFSEITMDKTYA